MLNAPATAEAVAELILDGAARSVDLRPFDPGRLRPAGGDPAKRAAACVGRKLTASDMQRRGHRT